jgi:small subunit ribosomal protein S9
MPAIPNPFTWGTGRRKTSVARIRIKDGKGQFLINDRPVDEFFRIPKDRSRAREPLAVAEIGSKLDIFANVHGGGTTGQAGAVAQGLARAIMKLQKPVEEAEPAAAPAEGEKVVAVVPLGKKLRKAGLITRDARMKERKKYGRKGARRSFQFSKR